MTPSSNALTPPSPRKALGLVLLGAGLAAFASEAALHAAGLLAVLGGSLWLIWGDFRTRRLVERLTATLPVQARDETVFREAARAWQDLESAKKKADTRIASEEELRRALLEHLNTGVVLLDAERRVRVYSPPARTLLGSSSHLVPGATALEAFREPESLRNIEMAFEGHIAEWQLRRNPRVLQLRAVPFPSLEGPPGALVTLDDVTRQEALETTRQKFISNASHELKTPVTSLRIAAENLLDGGLVTPEGASNVKAILRATERMTLLLEDISELSRIETGALRLEPDDLQVGEVAEGLLQDFQSEAQRRSLSLQQEVSPTLQKRVFQADPLRLQQLLGNLLSNAVKFSPEGGIVRLKAELDGPWIAWSISDQGPGIPESEQVRVFERFYRSPGARGIPGTGLGLAIVKHLSALMGGEVSLKSRPGQGATFTVRLPWAEKGSA